MTESIRILFKVLKLKIFSKLGNLVGSSEIYVDYTESCVFQKMKSLNFCSKTLLTAHALS